MPECGASPLFESKGGSHGRESCRRFVNTSMISTEREWRLVPVEITFDFTEGYKTFVRKDTGEVVKREAITEAERQQDLV